MKFFQKKGIREKYVFVPRVKVLRIELIFDSFVVLGLRLLQNTCRHKKINKASENQIRSQMSNAHNEKAKINNYYIDTFLV